MSTLELLKKKKKALLTSKHPCSEEDKLVRMSYLLGVGLAAGADEAINEKEESYLKNLGKSLILSEDETNQVLSMLEKPDDSTLETIIEGISNEKISAIMIIEILSLAELDGAINENEEAFILLLGDLMNMQESQIRTIQKLYQALNEEDYDAGDELLVVLNKFGIELRKNILTYYFPEKHKDITQNMEQRQEYNLPDFNVDQETENFYANTLKNKNYLLAITRKNWDREN